MKIYRMSVLANIALLATPGFAQSTDAAVAAVAPSSETTSAKAAVTTEANPAAPATANGSLPAPPAGKGQVVFFRGPTIVGAAISCAVHENGSKLSSLSRGHYVVLPAEPGIHSYSVKSESTDTLRLEIEPGETYFAQCSIGMGFMVGRPNLSPSDQNAFSAMSSKLTPVGRD